jgi:hypothetical protein
VSPGDDLVIYSISAKVVGVMIRYNSSRLCLKLFINVLTVGLQ